MMVTQSSSYSTWYRVKSERMLAASWKLWQQPLEKKQPVEDEGQYGQNLLIAAKQELS